MFEDISAAKKGQLPRYTAVSIGVHVVLVTLFLIAAAFRVKETEKKEIEVSSSAPERAKEPLLRRLRRPPRSA